MLFKRSESVDLIDSSNFDIKVLCCDKEIFAHRLVLGACSLWFRNILKLSEPEDEIQIITMNDFNPEDLIYLFDFIYGRVEHYGKSDLFQQLQIGDFTDVKKEEKSTENDVKCLPPVTTIVDPDPKHDDCDEEMDYEPLKENMTPPSVNECDNLNEENESDHEISMKVEVKVEPSLFNEDIVLKSTEHRKSGKTRLKKQSTKKPSNRSCEMCQFTPNRNAGEDLSKHYLKEHNILLHNGRFKCTSCAKKFTTKENLDIHMNVAHKGLKIKCGECSYECKNKSNLEKHKQKAHQGITFPCEQCDYIGSTKNKLREHVRVKHEGFKYMCDQCSHWTTDSSSLKHHKNSKHDNTTFPCLKCDYVGNTLKDLKKHTKIMHEPKKFLCDQCDYAAAELQTLTEHKMVNHEGFRLQCEFCDYSTKARSSLRDHRNVEHLGIKFLCDLCEYTGRNQSELKKHKAKRHEGLRFYCDQCDYSALAKATVKEHKKVKHEGLRFYCDECPCIFICKENLKKHKNKRHNTTDGQQTDGRTTTDRRDTSDRRDRLPPTAIKADIT